MPNRINNAIQALARLDKAKDAAIAAFHIAYPVGSLTRFVHGEAWRHIEIVDHLYGFDVRVRNKATGRKYRVDGRRILRAHTI